MELKGASLYSEMQSFAQQARGMHQELRVRQSNLESLPKVDEINTSSNDFSSLLKMALDNVNGLQQESNAKATAVELGDPNVTLAQAMIAGQKASIAFEATVQVRNKLVEAYKEIMSMPV